MRKFCVMRARVTSFARLTWALATLPSPAGEWKKTQWKTMNWTEAQVIYINCVERAYSCI